METIGTAIFFGTTWVYLLFQYYESIESRSALIWIQNDGEGDKEERS
jgi:hypothetical protein